MPAAARSRRRRRSFVAADTPALEWVLGVLGALMLAAAVAYLVYEGVASREAPGPIVVDVLAVTRFGNSYHVAVVVRNEGRETLSGLQLVARLWDGEREIENARMVLDYAPGRSERRGGFYLRHDPREHRLEITPEGYQAP